MKIHKFFLLGAVLSIAAAPVVAAEAEKKADAAAPAIEAEKAPAEHHGWFGMHFRGNHDGRKEMHRGCPFGGEMDFDKKPGKGHDCKGKECKGEGKGKKDKKGMKNMPEMFPGFQGQFGGMMPGMKNLKKISDDDVLDMVKDADSSFAKKLKEMKKDNPKKYKMLPLFQHPIKRRYCRQ